MGQSSKSRGQKKTAETQRKDERENVKTKKRKKQKNPRKLVMSTRQNQGNRKNK